MRPVSWFSCSSREIRPESDPSAGGIAPVSWLLYSHRRLRAGNSPSSAGMRPVSWLSCSQSSRRLRSDPSAGGIDPLSWLASSHRTSRWRSDPSSGGIGPVSRLWWRPSSRSSRTLARWGATRPVRPRDRRCSFHTRGGSPPRLTPSHSAMGVSPPQLSGVRAVNWVLAASRLAQSMTRPRLASGSATTMPFSQVAGAAWAGPDARPASSSAAKKKEKAHLRTDHLRPEPSPLPRDKVGDRGRGGGVRAGSRAGGDSRGRGWGCPGATRGCSRSGRGCRYMRWTFSRLANEVVVRIVAPEVV